MRVSIAGACVEGQVFSHNYSSAVWAFDSISKYFLSKHSFQCRKGGVEGEKGVFVQSKF